MGRSVDQGKRAEWRRRLARYAVSGQTVAAFCAGEQVSAPSFYMWKKKLAADSPNGRSVGPSLSPARQDFVPIQIDGSALVEIELPNGAQVRIPSRDFGAIGAAVEAAGRLPRHVDVEAARC